MNPTDDLIIIDKVLKGNTHAFSRLVDHYKDMVFTLAHRMLKDRIKAEEIAQDVFIKIFKKLDTFKGQSKFSSWVYRITYNTCLDTLRKQQKNYKLLSINEFTEHELVNIDNALDQMQADELKETINQCLEKLPGDMGFLLTLYYFSGYSVKEIAKIVDLKSNNVKVKLHRSRLKLTGLLKHELEPETLKRYGYK